jgi:hypothetical protein
VCTGGDGVSVDNFQFTYLSAHLEIPSVSVTVEGAYRCGSSGSRCVDGSSGGTLTSIIFLSTNWKSLISLLLFPRHMWLLAICTTKNFHPYFINRPIPVAARSKA